MYIIQLSFIIHTLVKFSDVLFSGLKIIIPVVFLINLLQINNKYINSRNTVLSVNLLLLAAGIFFSFSFVTDTLMSLRPDSEFGFSFILNVATGPNWYVIVIPIINYTLLPQLMWFKKIRNYIYTSFSIVIFWILSNNIIENIRKSAGTYFPTKKQEMIPLLKSYSTDVLIAVVCIIVIFLYLEKKGRKNSFNRAV